MTPRYVSSPLRHEHIYIYIYIYTYILTTHVTLQTKESKRLALEDFDGPFITHGIDVLADPEKPTEAVYIFAINHIPNEAVFPRDGASSSSPPPLSKKDTTTTTTTTTSSQEKAASRIEVFHHVLGSSSAQHRRTMAHPLIRTPNDLVATSPTSVYVSNDHYYREGRLRALEDMYPGATWSDVVHATTLAGDEGTATVAATVVLDRLWNPNGVGRGRTEDEIVIASAVGGYLNVYGHLLPRTQEEDKKSGGGGGGDDVRNIVLNETIDLDSTIDNPTWFADPYAIDDKSDASGFVLGGLARAVDLSKTGHDPQGREGVLVWHVTPRKGKDGGGGGGGGWDKKLLWQDDGRMIRNTATAVLVAIDPAREQGAKKAWLFVTGFSSANAVAVKVDL